MNWLLYMQSKAVNCPEKARQHLSAPYVNPITSVLTSLWRGWPSVLLNVRISPSRRILQNRGAV